MLIKYLPKKKGVPQWRHYWRARKQRKNLSARIVPCWVGTAVQPPGLLKAHQSVCVLRDISAAWHHPRSLASSWEEYGTVPALPQGSGQEGTLPGADTWWASGSCHGAHRLGSARERRKGEGRGAGTVHRQLVKLAQGAHSILSHAIVAFRQGNLLARAPGPASVVVSGSPRFPKLQMSLEFSRLSFSNVLPWLLMEGRTEGSTRLLYYRALIEGQSQQNFTANCHLGTPLRPYS